MARSIGYIRYSCPCTNTSIHSAFETDASREPKNEHEGNEEEESTFDPSNLRSNHALYPLDNLLFCNECHEIRCPRCYYEEVLYYYCPQCLMETASTTVRTETNR